MSIKLNQAAYNHAENCIRASEFETFETDWKEAAPTPDEVDYFINTHYMKEYGLWFLGKDESKPESAKEHYLYPHGDLKVVQKVTLEHTVQEAEKRGHAEIAQAAKKLLALLK